MLAVLTSSMPRRLWCAVAEFRSSAPRREGADRGRRGLKVDRLLRRAASALKARQAVPPYSGSLHTNTQEELMLEFSLK